MNKNTQFVQSSPWLPVECPKAVLPKPVAVNEPATCEAPVVGTPLENNPLAVLCNAVAALGPVFRPIE